jgi:thiamine biosynthesis protein ThiS
VTGDALRVTVNGRACRAEAGTRLVDFLRGQGLDPARVAVERNREVVPRARHAEVELRDGDVLEVVHFVGGG